MSQHGLTIKQLLSRANARRLGMLCLHLWRVLPSINARALKNQSSKKQQCYSYACLIFVSLVIGNSAAAELLPAPNPPLKDFTVTTPSPITDYSTISQAHIAQLERIFSELGYRLIVVHDSKAKSAPTFLGGRYDGSIFLDGTDLLPESQQVKTPIEHVHMVFFTQASKTQLLSSSTWPNGTRVAVTANGKKAITQYFPDLEAKVTFITANQPSQILRLVQSQRADIGLTAQPMFASSYAHEQFRDEHFEFVSDLTIERNLYLYVQQEYRDLIPQLDALLQERYLPNLDLISNN